MADSATWPTSYGDSPYQSFSTFAGNPYFIDLEQLVGEGLLTEDECEEADFGDDDRYIAYDKIYKARFKVLKKAYERWKKDHHQFLKSKLDPETIEYCFYMAVKDHLKVPVGTNGIKISACVTCGSREI